MICPCRPLQIPRNYINIAPDGRSKNSKKDSKHLRKCSCTGQCPCQRDGIQYSDLLHTNRLTFSADGLKPLPSAVGPATDCSAGAETRRVSLCETTTMHANTHDRGGELFETGEERLRPTHVQHPWTWDIAHQALKRQLSGGKTATSNTSRVTRLLPNYRHRVSFSLMSSFRDVGGYPGRIGRKGSACRYQAVEQPSAGILRPGALDVNRTPLDVTRRCHR